MQKVYVLEDGEWSERVTVAVFTTRQLAEDYAVERERRRWRQSEDKPFPERTGSFNDWEIAIERISYHVLNVTEYDVWDVIPIADLRPFDQTDQSSPVPRVVASPNARLPIIIPDRPFTPAPKPGKRG